MGELDRGGSPPKTNKVAAFGRWGSRVGLGVVIIAAIRLVALVAERPDRASHDLAMFLTVVLVAVAVYVVFKWVYSAVLFRSRAAVQRANPDDLVVVGRVTSDFHDAVRELNSRGFGTEMALMLANPIISIGKDVVIVWYGRSSPRVGVQVPSEYIKSVRPVSRNEGRKSVPGIEWGLDVAGTDIGLSWSFLYVGLFGLRVARGKRFESMKQQVNALLRDGKDAGAPDAE